MPRLATHADPDMPASRDNAEAMRTLVEELQRRLERVRRGGGDDAVAKHEARGKLTARARVDRLVDPGSAFLELSPLAAEGLYDDAAPGAGIVTGIGSVHERPCVIVANDATVKGGTYFPMTVPAGRSFRCRRRSFPIGTISGGSSTTRRGCRPRASRRSPR
jgi:3-methylcrotonyl-CoA carboxylase beta subunit